MPHPKGKNHPRWKNKIEKYCETCKKIMFVIPSLEHRKRFCSRICLGIYTCTKKNIESKPEIEMARSLANRGILFNKNFQIGKWEVDFFIESENLCIEIDGEYWHSLPKNKIRDFQKDEYLKNKNFRVLRFPSRLVINNPDMFVDIVIKECKGNICGKPYTYNPKNKLKDKCYSSGCIRDAAKRGLCECHYYRLRNHGDIFSDIPIKGTLDHCIISGCNGKIASWGLCSTHYQRWIKYHSIEKHQREYKLSSENVKEIRRRHEKKESTSLLAEEFGVTDGHISNVIYGRTWKNV